MTDRLKFALAAIRADWPVIPLHNITKAGVCSCGKAKCHSPGKHPRTENGIKDATTDEKQIRKWWSRWPQANIGGRLDGLVAVDVDIGPRRRGGETVEVRGDLQLKAAEMIHGALPRLLVQDTGSGSQHILFRLPADLEPRLRKKLPGCRDVDLKFGANAYICLHGSNHEQGRDYEWRCGLDAMPLRLDILPDAPEWIGEEHVRKTDEVSDKDDSTITIADAHNRKAFESFEDLEDCVMAVKNDERFETRDDWLNLLAAIHFESDGSEEGRELAHRWSDTWRGGDDPELTDKLWDSFGKKGSGRMKTGATIIRFAKQDGWEPPDEPEKPEAKVDDPNAPDDDDDNATRWTKKLNYKHAFVMQAGKALVVNEHSDHGITWSKKADFLQSYENKKTTVPGPPGKNGKFTFVEKPVGQVWFTHKKRRQYLKGVTFDPTGTPEGYYNLWRGFSVKADTLGLYECNLFLEHIFDNICKRDKKLYRWFVGWLAHCIQHPGKKPGAAVALQGKMGVGKSIIGDVMKVLMDAHAIKIAAGKHLTGTFNAHMSHAIFVQIEEAFWVGDKAGAQVMKDLVTGPTIRIEPKGIDSFEIDSYHRLLLTSNEDWVVPMGMEDRRFVVIECGEDRIQDRAYFGAMFDQLEEGKGGGYRALMHFFETYDLTGIDVGQPVVTEANIKQKIASLVGVDLWWTDILDSGDIPASHGEDYGDWEGGWITIENKTIYCHYENWHSRRRFQGDPVGSAQFTKKLKAWCPGIRTKRIRDGDNMIRGLEIPPLEVCKKAREKRLYGPNRR